jgi:phage protein D
MPAFMTLYDESVDPTNRDFYAPGFELRIDGVGLPQGVLRDVMQVTYHDNINEIDGFELTVNNWDASARCCKYIGSETQQQLSGGSKASKLFTLFNPGGKSAELALGYSGNFETMVRATFTTMEPNFPESGPPVLTVRASNILKGLRTKQFTSAWTNQTPSAIALNFNSLRNGGQPRLPSPWKVVTTTQAASNEDKIEYVAQKNQYDADFLLQLAHGQGYTLEADEDTNEIRFGPSQSATPTNYQLEWGKGLMSFKPSLATANQWKSVTVRGWDRQTQKPIVVKIGQDDPQVKKLNSNLLSLVPDRQEQTVDLPVFTVAEAKQYALAIMLDRSKEIVTAHGKTVGLPKLRAGTLVSIQGIGARLSGTYFVTKTTHTLGENGYVTEFDCRRENLGAGGTSS